MRRGELTVGVRLGIICGVEGYRVRLGDREVQCDLEGLFVLAEAGKISVDTQICQPGAEVFQRADSLIELSGKIGVEDPWAAWDEMESATSDWQADAPDEESDEDDLDMDTQIITTPVDASQQNLASSDIGPPLHHPL